MRQCLLGPVCPDCAKLHHTNTGYGHVVQHHQQTSSVQFYNLLYNKFVTSQCQSPTSRHVQMVCGKFLFVGGEFVVQVVELLWARRPRPLVVLYNMSVAGVRVVEFSTKQARSYGAPVSAEQSIEIPGRLLDSIADIASRQPLRSACRRYLTVPRYRRSIFDRGTFLFGVRWPGTRPRRRTRRVVVVVLGERWRQHCLLGSSVQYCLAQHRCCMKLRYVNLGLRQYCWKCSQKQQTSRFIMRPHYASCPPVSPSVCLSACLVTWYKSFSGQSGWSFSWKGQRSRSPDVKKLKKLPHIWRTCLLTGGGSSVGGSGADCKLGLTIVRPNLLSTPETLRNWTDGRISCDIFSCSV